VSGGDPAGGGAGAGVRTSDIEWDAATYHRVSDPQFGWGLRVLERLELRGDEVAIDAGCGSGRLTAELCARLPRGRVIAVDRSQNMLEEARARLEPRFGDRVSFRAADLHALVVPERVDLIFSTATLHWVLDHPRMLRHLFEALCPGGRLVAQCGGAGNIARLRARAHERMASPRLAPFFAGWAEPWEYPSAEVEAARLRDAGFVEVEAELEPAPTPFPDAGAFRIFLERVVLRLHVGRLPNPEAVADLLDPLVAQAAGDDPPYTLDYVRLNIRARRP
jgi:ubiquinone/menaquinone biosynthesis C-methylase UbiE